MLHTGDCTPKDCGDCVQGSPLIMSPICGSNGKTYNSECEIDVFNCEHNDSVRKMHDGECLGPCIDCDMTIIAPVCGDDGQTYDNDCLLSSRNCNMPTSEHIKKVHDGSCRPKCDQMCSTINRPGTLNIIILISTFYKFAAVMVQHIQMNVG